MSKIQLLDNATIDKIAAGEVVERPSSVVKELVENAIDAGATAVTIEIKDGGISFIRVTDNGNGIPASQVKDAFLRHATSKIRTVDDLNTIHSLGFRGEALSSISAVAQVEIMTKEKQELMGIHYQIEGGLEKDFSQVGVPDGTTILVKNLFFNTPARRKFLKTAVTEGGYIADLCEHLAMSKPNIAFRFIANNQVKFHTSGNGDIREIIYRIFGKDFISQLIPIEARGEGIEIKGYLGKPTLNRSNRNFENCFMNGRFVKSSFLFKAIEEGYRAYLMQHKFPFVVLYFTMDTDKVDVNVHPTKMDIRITDSHIYYDFIVNSISNTLQKNEMIPDMEQLDVFRKPAKAEIIPKTEVPETFESKRMEEYREKIKEDFSYNIKQTIPVKMTEAKQVIPDTNKNFAQINLFEEKIIKQENKHKFEIIGQIFQTYWLVRFEDKLLFVDQHAAHEKVKYERLMASLYNKEIASQLLQPPLICHLTQKEAAALEEYQDYFENLGFSWEDFGSNSIAIRQIPMELYGKNEKLFFEDVITMII